MIGSEVYRIARLCVDLKSARVSETDAGVEMQAVRSRLWLLLFLGFAVLVAWVCFLVDFS